MNNLRPISYSTQNICMFNNWTHAITHYRHVACAVCLPLNVCLRGCRDKEICLVRLVPRLGPVNTSQSRNCFSVCVRLPVMEIAHGHGMTSLHQSYGHGGNSPTEGTLESFFLNVYYEGGVALVAYYLAARERLRIDWWSRQPVCF